MRFATIAGAAALLAVIALPCAALPRGGVSVDVSPLRRAGDAADAEYVSRVLPAYLAQSFGPGHNVRVRIDDVTYGEPGSLGPSNMSAIDYIEGVGIVDGRTVPLHCSVVATVTLPDTYGDAGRQRQDTLMRAFAQWLPRQANW